MTALFEKPLGARGYRLFEIHDGTAVQPPNGEVRFVTCSRDIILTVVDAAGASVSVRVDADTFKHMVENLPRMRAEVTDEACLIDHGC